MAGDNHKHNLPSATQQQVKAISLDNSIKPLSELPRSVGDYELPFPTILFCQSSHKGEILFGLFHLIDDKNFWEIKNFQDTNLKKFYFQFGRDRSRRRLKPTSFWYFKAPVFWGISILVSFKATQIFIMKILWHSIMFVNALRPF